MERSKVRKDESVTRLDVLAGQGAINFGEHTLTGHGTIADVLTAHGLKPSDLRDDGQTFAEMSLLVDNAPRLVYILTEIFPKLEYVTIHRCVSSRDGGGSYPWKEYRLEWLADKNKWRFHPRTL
jgi:hypothetical protein